LITSW
jgi:hypothetical protein